MNSPERQPTDWKAGAMRRRIRRRYGAERRFRALGFAAVVLSAAFLAYLLFTMAFNGVQGFVRTDIALPFDFPAAHLQIDRAQLAAGNPAALADPSLPAATQTQAAAEAAFGKTREPLISDGAWQKVRDAIRADPAILDRKAVIRVPASEQVDRVIHGEGAADTGSVVARLRASGALTRGFNSGFLTQSDSSDPTAVGIWGALKGSILTLLVTFLVAFPVGLLSAVLSRGICAAQPLDRADRGPRSTTIAAVPSIIFGLLGLAVFLGTFALPAWLGGATIGPMLPRSAPIVGGLTLALMILPVIVIASRNAIKAVPPSIRDAALAIGASRVQVVFHHVLPLGLPGILTGTIIGMARALGETAPLLLIGMRAFIATPPGGFTDPATVLPVQIFLWSDEVSRGFVDKTSAAIIVLLVFLLAMNGLAIYLRNRFETRW